MGGQTHKTVFVTTNDPENSFIKLYIAANVKIILSTLHRVNFGFVMKDSQPVKYVSLKGEDKDTTKIKSVKYNDKFMKVDINPEGFDNKKNNQIRITLKPGLPMRKFREMITAVTNHSLVKEITIVAFGEVTGNIDFQPKTLSFGGFKKGSRIERTIKLTSLFDRNFKILNVKSSVPELETRVETVKEGREYNIIVTLNEKFNTKYLQESIIIETDDKDQKSIEVKAFGAVLNWQKNN
jgi:hypothetical protein